MATPAVDSTGASIFEGASNTRVLSGEINNSQRDHISTTVIFNIGTSNSDTSRDTPGASETTRPGSVRNASSDQEQEVHSDVMASNSDASRATLAASETTRSGSVRNTPSDQDQSPIREDSSVFADSDFNNDTSLDIAPPKEDNSVVKEPGYAIYQRHMYLEKHGFPLWIPQPNMRLSRSYRRQGVNIGDVGIFTSNGGFDFLFSICLPAGHPSNPDELPTGFSQLHLKPADVCEFRAHSSHSHMASPSIQKQGSATFDCSDPDGAILIMPQGAYDEDLRNIIRFRDYALTHAESWYEYANGPCGRDVGNKELHLVTGCDKTASWGIATYSHLQPKRLEDKVTQISFNTASNERQGRHSLYPTYSWDHKGTAEPKVGPEDDELMDLLDVRDSAPLRNQCTFIRSLTPGFGDDDWERLQVKIAAAAEDRASARPSHKTFFSSVLGAIGSLPGRIGSFGGHSRVGTSRLTDSLAPARTLAAHPATYVIDVLLQKCPNAKVVVVHDSDWCSVIRDSDKDWMTTAQDLPRRIQEAFDIVEYENGTAYLQEKTRSSQQPNTSSHLSIDLGGEDTPLLRDREPSFLQHFDSFGIYSSDVEADSPPRAFKIVDKGDDGTKPNFDVSGGADLESMKGFVHRDTRLNLYAPSDDEDYPMSDVTVPEPTSQIPKQKNVNRDDTMFDDDSSTRSKTGSPSFKASLPQEYIDPLLATGNASHHNPESSTNIRGTKVPIPTFFQDDRSDIVLDDNSPSSSKPGEHPTWLDCFPDFPTLESTWTRLERESFELFTPIRETDPPTPSLFRNVGSDTVAGDNSPSSSKPPTQIRVVASPAQVESSRRRRKNLGPGKFVCELCSQDFTTNANLQNHLNSHSGYKPHRCLSGCGGAFSTKSSLRRHSKSCKATSVPM